MNRKLFFGALVLFFYACTSPNQPLTEPEKERSIDEAKGLISTIYQAAENCDAAKMTSTYLDSPDFISLINGEFANYEETIKKYPKLVAEFKTQKSTVLYEKYSVLDASTILYSSKSNWECKFQNDSIGVFNGAVLQLLLKKAGNDWKVLSWTEAF